MEMTATVSAKKRYAALTTERLKGRSAINVTDLMGGSNDLAKSHGSATVVQNAREILAV